MICVLFWLVWRLVWSVFFGGVFPLFVVFVFYFGVMFFVWCFGRFLFGPKELRKRFCLVLFRDFLIVFFPLGISLHGCDLLFLS